MDTKVTFQSKRESFMTEINRSKRIEIMRRCKNHKQPKIKPTDPESKKYSHMANYQHRQTIIQLIEQIDQEKKEDFNLLEIIKLIFSQNL